MFQGRDSIFLSASLIDPSFCFCLCMYVCVCVFTIHSLLLLSCFGLLLLKIRFINSPINRCLLSWPFSSLQYVTCRLVNRQAGVALVLKTLFHSDCCCCCSVSRSCPNLCNPFDCSTPGFPVLHHLLELAQTHVHWVGDAIQPSHSVLSPSPPAFSLSQDQGLF